MKILILSFYYPPDLSAGSFRMAAFIEALGRSLSDQDSIEILTTYPNRYRTYRIETSGFESIGNLIVRRFKIPAHKSAVADQAISFTFFFVKVLLHVRKIQPDIVFATTSRLFTGFLGAVIARWKRIPFYLDMRDIFTDSIQSVLGHRRARWLLPLCRLIEAFTVNTANKVNLVSQGFITYFSSRYKNNWSFFSNGIDDDFLHFEKIQTCSTSIKRITYSGNIGAGQGLEKIVPLIAGKYNDIEFLIVGDGGKKNALRTAVRNLKNVKLLDPVGRNELIAIYEKSDMLFLQLNNYDAFKKVLPSKIFEYAATYKPILAGVDGYARCFLEENLPDSLIFRPCDFNDFCAKFEGKDLEVDFGKRREFISRFLRRNIMREMAMHFLSSFQTVHQTDREK